MVFFRAYPEPAWLAPGMVDAFWVGDSFARPLLADLGARGRVDLAD
jgi:hypothetical protein